jgi:hypothetical protein
LLDLAGSMKDACQHSTFFGNELSAFIQRKACRSSDDWLSSIMLFDKRVVVRHIFTLVRSNRHSTVQGKTFLSASAEHHRRVDAMELGARVKARRLKHFDETFRSSPARDYWLTPLIADQHHPWPIPGRARSARSSLGWIQQQPALDDRQSVLFTDGVGFRPVDGLRQSSIGLRKQHQAQ